MEATENMKLLASWMSLCIKKELPDFDDIDATSVFIAENKEEFDALATNVKNKMYSRALKVASRVINFDSIKPKAHIGKWLEYKMRGAVLPFDTIENINEADRFDMAKLYWNEEGCKRWGFFKRLDGKPMTVDELLPFIARDLDYRIIKNTAKYIFKITDKPAGSVIIDPDAYPYRQIKIQYRVTYSLLKDEAKSYSFKDYEKREYLQ
jgi:hypothetical protein